MIQDLPGCDAIVDDILIWDGSTEEHDGRLTKVLKRVEAQNLKLSPEKCKCRQNQVTYVGHILCGQSET